MGFSLQNTASYTIFLIYICSFHLSGSNADIFIVNGAKMTEIPAMYYASKVLTQQFAGIVHGRYLGHFCTVYNENKYVRTARVRRT